VHDYKSETALPVRKIPKNYLGVTGGFASRKNGRMLGFESLLEKDLFVLLEYDDEVLSFEEQPVRIPLNGKGRSYVPDVVIHYRQKSSSRIRKPNLTEVKAAEDLKKNKAKYANKFAVAKRWASGKGWVFQTRSDKDIRGLRLDFLKFLREYHCIEPDPADISQVFAVLGQLGGCASFKNLLHALCSSEEAQLMTIPVIWHMAATRQLIVDLDQAVTDEVLLTIRQDRTKA
jgi:hypothetical protein